MGNDTFVGLKPSSQRAYVIDIVHVPVPRGHDDKGSAQPVRSDPLLGGRDVPLSNLLRPFAYPALPTDYVSHPQYPDPILRLASAIGSDPAAQRGRLWRWLLHRRAEQTAT